MWREGRPQEETCYIKSTALWKPQLDGFLAHCGDFWDQSPCELPGTEQLTGTSGALAHLGVRPLHGEQAGLGEPAGPGLAGPRGMDGVRSVLGSQARFPRSSKRSPLAPGLQRLRPHQLLRYF